MDKKNITIVVSGDICINVFQWITYNHNNGGLNWQNHLNMHTVYMPGESLLLSELIALATGASIRCPKIEDIELKNPNEVLCSTAELDLFPKSSAESATIYRINRLLGFTRPSSGTIKLLPINNDTQEADIVIIDDENNGFNSNKDFWPLALKTTDKSPIIIYKMSNPTGTSELWEQLESFYFENTVVVINGDDLRSKGVNISNSLSWERTSLDFVWQLNNNPNLSFLANCRHLIIPFGLEGAIYYSNSGVAESELYFLPYEFEGGTVRDNQGKMIGFTSCFVAGLTKSIVSGENRKEKLAQLIGEGIREGVVATHRYFFEGFGKDVYNFSLKNLSIFSEESEDTVLKEHVQDVKIPNLRNSNCYSCWYILKDKSSMNLAEIAYNIVKNGEKDVLKYIPIAHFGKLKTVDRTEIESYRSIKKLMMEYVYNKNTVRPLSIAVFGTPGSGKSFGISEIAASIAPQLIKKINFNLSQFRSHSDLINAFHKVRDLSLEGYLPLVFFDEFDSSFEGKLGWLKYFLAPMQDGIFREGDSTHPLGKAIFVFAGGTSSTFKEFCGEGHKDGIDEKLFKLEFRGAKGPDFISRLRGYVNILGPNQTNSIDQLFIIRRAMLLRSLLELKVPHLINEKGEAQIDNGVLRALLKVPKYKHESRSMEAIMEMSMLTQAHKWEQSHLPSREQLKLHVDEEQFMRHLMHDAFYSEKIESIAATIHEKSYVLNEVNNNSATLSHESWDSLSEDMKNSLRDQAKHIPDVLLRANYDIISVKDKPEIIEFSDREIDTLSMYEHLRWCLYTKETGWKYDEVKDIKNKTDPGLVSWSDLTDDRKNKIYQLVKTWPEILAGSHFKIERLKYICKCEL